MRVLIDFRSYQISYNRGIGRYVLALTEELARIPEMEVSVLISENLHQVEFTTDISKNIRIYVLEIFSQYDIEGNFDFFIKGNFFDGFSSPSVVYPPEVLKKCNDIVGILHDLIPLIYAGNYLNNYYKKNYLSCFELMKYASHFFCNSQMTKDDGIKYMQRCADDFTVIYGGADEHRFYSPNHFKTYTFRNRLNNIVFNAGTDRRKNYQGAVKAFAMAYDTGQLPKDAKLYLVCDKNEHFVKDVEKAAQGHSACVGKQIIITGYIPDGALVDLLSTAKASIFPSFYEGLGLPILESYMVGTPSFASNCSSTKEFVMEEAAFNPHDMEEMRNLIIRIFNDEKLCKKSLAWGRNLLEKINWSSSVKTMVKKLIELKDKRCDEMKHKTGKTAVFTILPPCSSGIAPYSFKTHALFPKKYDIFSNIQNIDDYIALQKDASNNIFPLTFYAYAKREEKYRAELFVFGNSYHHKEIVEYAIKTRGDSKNRFMYLHEAFLVFLFFPLFDNDLEKMKEFLIHWYPERKQDILKFTKLDMITLLNLRICGIRPLLSLTGIKHIFVNTEKARKLIEDELTAQELKSVTIDVFYHPLEKITAGKIDLHDNLKQQVIGTFGIPSELKNSEEIYHAVKQLNQRGHKIKVVYAGYSCRTLRKKMPESFVEIYDSPSDEKLYALMNSVDLAVQLRPYTKGEVSGCISQLLSMGKNILTSDGFVPYKMASFCHIISGKPDADVLGEKLLQALSTSKKYDFNRLCVKYNYKNLSVLIDKTIEKYMAKSL